jgi:hypothetical protein
VPNTSDARDFKKSEASFRSHPVVGYGLRDRSDKSDKLQEINGGRVRDIDHIPITHDEI